MLLAKICQNSLQLVCMCVRCLCIEDELQRVKLLYHSLRQEVMPGHPHEISAM